MSHASTVEALLFAALDKPTAAERAAFLDSACAGDAELRRQVERLLQAHAHVGDFLQKPVGEQLAAAPEPADATQEIDASTAGPGAGPPGGTGLYLARTEGAGARAEDNSLDFLEPSTRPDSLGRVGHYEVLQILGKGGFGIVFRAFDEQLQRVVAIKVLAPEMAATSPARKRFLREARSSARVRHENVVQIYAVEEEPLPYLVMEFVPGETLQQRLDRTGPLKAPEALRIGGEIAEGLAAAHAQGLIHRDIKPGNILIEAGPNQHVKITDFGLARAADDASLSQSGVVAGTPLYMAPEQASADPLDHRADLFSLGSVLYTMCSGRPPFRAPTTLAVLKRVVEDTPRPIREIIPEVPVWLCDLIAKLHAKKPDERFATAHEVAELLGRGLAALQHPGSVKPPQITAPAAVPKTPAQEVPEAAPTIKPRSRSRRWLVAAALFLTLLGGLGLMEATGVTNVRGTVIRLFSPEGTLVVEVDDPGVSVQIDGEDLVITGAGAREVRLKPGRYTVEARKDGKLVSRELVTITKDGRQVVRVSQEGTPPETDPDRRAAEHVLSLGGTVRVNGQDQEIRAVAELPREAFRLTFVSLRGNKQVTDMDVAGLKGCKNLTHLDLLLTQVSDAGLANFKECKNLTYLALGRTMLTDAGLAHFEGCKNLAYLDLSAVPVTDTGLGAFKDCKNLTFLQLQETQVTDSGLAHFKDNNNLTTIILYHTKVGEAGLAHFKVCKHLTSLNLGATQLTDAGLAHFSKSHGNLTTLWMHQTAITDAGLAHLAGLSALTGLDLSGTKVTAKGVEGLAMALSKCNIKWDGGVSGPKPDGQASDADRKAAEYVLSIGGAVKVNEQGQEIAAAADLPRESFRLTMVQLARNKQVTDAALAIFEDCRNLTHLSLWQTNVGDEGLVHVKECKAVTHLWLGSTKVTDAGLAHLDGRTNLVLVDLLNTNVTDAGLAYLKGCRGLDNLSLIGTGVTDAGLANLKDCKGLTGLYLIRTEITDAGLTHLAGLDKLSHLILKETKVTAKGAEGLAKALPKCKIEWDGGVIEPK